jgi:hypothetical protein
MAAVFEFSMGLLLIWFAISLTMPEPAYVATRLIHVGRRQPHEAKTLSQELTAICGVTEAIVIAEEGVAYLKVDTHALDEGALDKFRTASAPATGP